MPPSMDAALLAQLAREARLLEVERVELRSLRGCEPRLLRRLFAAGAQCLRLVVQYDDDQPFVIEKAVLTISGLVIEAHALPRPASPGERRALDSGEAFYCIDSCRVVELNHVD